MLKYDYHTKRVLTHLTVLNLASLTLQSNASPTAPIVASGTHAAVSTHHAFLTSAMMARSSAVARRNVFHYYSCFTLSYYFRCEPVRYLVSIGNVPTVIRATTQVETPIKDLLQICSTMLPRGSTPAIWHVWLWQLKTKPFYYRLHVIRCK